MTNLKSFLKEKKKIGYVMITLVLVFLFTSLLTARNDQTLANATVIDREALCTGSHSGYDVVKDEAGNYTFTPNNGDPQITVDLPAEGVVFNRITLRIAEAVEESIYVQIYYAANGNDLSEPTSYHTHIYKGMDFLSLYIPARSYTQLRLVVNGSFTPTELSLESVEHEGYYTFNVIACVLLVAALVLLAVFNRRIGYYSAVAKMFKAAVVVYRQEREQGVLRAFLYVAAWLSTLIYAATFILLLLFTHVSPFSLKLMLAMAVVSVSLQLLWRGISKHGNQAAKLFLVVIILVGTLFAYCLPITTGVSWDDQIHYERAENLSRLLFGHKQTLADCDQEMFIYHVDANLQDFQGVNLSLLGDSREVTAAEGVFVNFYTHISYLHMALFIAVCGWIGVDFVQQMILLKLINVLIYGVVIYFGLKKLKSGARLMSAICLLPTAVFMASTITYDFWVIAFLSYAMATILSVLQRHDEPMDMPTLWRIVAAIVIGCGAKAIYFVLFLPLLFMLKYKSESKEQRKRFTMICAAALAIVLISFVLPFFVNMGSRTDLRGGADVNAGGQIKYIFTHPFEYAGNLLEFMGNYVGLNFAWSFCTYFAYLGYPSDFYTTVVMVLIGFLAFADKNESDDFPMVGRYRLLNLAAVFAQIALVATALYISFTPVGHDTVNGCQWRYIIPALFPMLYSLGSPKVVMKQSDRVLNLVTFGIMAAILMASVYDVYIVAF